MEPNKNGFLSVSPDVHESNIPIDVFGSYPRVPSSSESVWLLGHLYLVAIAAFLGACTPGPETLKRVAIEAPKEIRAGLTRDVGVENHKVEPVEPAKKVGEEGENREVANLEIDLTNFKDRLSTLSGAEVIELMGRPEFERFEPPARIWQYRTQFCVVDIFLYDDGGIFAVEYVNLRMRGPGRNKFNDRACFASITQKPAQHPGEAYNSVDPDERGARVLGTKIRQTGPASSDIR